MNTLLALTLMAGSAADNIVINNSMANETLRVGAWVMSLVLNILDAIGLERNSIITSCTYLLIVFAISWAIGYALEYLIIRCVNGLAGHYDNDMLNNLKRGKFFSKICRIVPPCMFLILIQLTLNTMHKCTIWLERATCIYISIVLAVAFVSLIDALWDHINTRQNQKKLPLNGLVQLLKVTIWVLLTIVCVAVILDKSPLSLIAGLGAFAAVLMLVFKDSILGVVAGVQLSENNSLHVGDWIKVSGTDADGIVSEVSLTAVTVLNWDKTTTSLPPYSLVSGSFTNYRSMQESNTRRIRRSWMIDADSIVPVDDKLKAQIEQVPFMADYFNHAGSDPSHPTETNLGAFRAYLEMYLAASKVIDPASYRFVTTLAQTNGGVPLQLYCFSNTSAWVDYEHIQAMIFEHVAVMMAKFNLYTFENASGRDTIIDGYLSNGRSPADLLGIPYPFLSKASKADTQ